VVRGTVTDAVTGQPIAGARVDDNFYGTSPNRPPQQAGTDAWGHYELSTWNEEHTLAASAPGYQTKLETFMPRQGYAASGQSKSSETRVLAVRVGALETTLSNLQAQASHTTPLPEEANRSLQEQITKAQDQLMDAKRELLERKAMLGHQIDFQLRPAESAPVRP
jgi:hypothetical protein